VQFWGGAICAVVKSSNYAVKNAAFVTRFSAPNAAASVSWNRKRDHVLQFYKSSSLHIHHYVIITSHLTLKSTKNF